MGGSSNLRGFEGGRFRDRMSLLLVTEYRYPVRKWIDGLLFLEEGRVASGFGTLHPSGLHLSYGAGLRFRTPEHFFFELQGAHSTDGTRFVFSMNQTL
jgi:outer membrane protein assembly factor BamA